MVGIQSGEDCRRLLEMQARLQAYSPTNVTLISVQAAAASEKGRAPVPEPGYVAGFNNWKPWVEVGTKASMDASAGAGTL
jgi:hypothetical protein